MPDNANAVQAYRFYIGVGEVDRHVKFQNPTLTITPAMPGLYRMLSEATFGLADSVTYK